MRPFSLLCLLSLTLASAALVASTALPAFAIDQSRIPKTKPLPRSVQDQIQKCDLAELACKKKCDDTIIDIDNQIELCKQKCGNDRAMCSMMRQGPGAGTGTTGVNPATPPPAIRN
jgi:hypothetical protein